MTTCAWKSDAEPVVLEIPASEGCKTNQDAEVCSLRELLHELEESGVTDATINSHECNRAPVAGQAGESSEGLCRFLSH